MKRHPGRVRVATYNVHRCKGLDSRVRPARIAEVLRELDADIVALQEVVSISGGPKELDQARYLAESLHYHHAMGRNRTLRGGAYGNVVLSRFPLRSACNYDLSVDGRERRGCLRTDVELDRHMLLHVFNVHLGTAFLERRRQARKLVAAEVIQSRELNGPRIVLGDFNEWICGLVTRMLARELESPDIRRHLGRSRTYPGLLPLMHLDHIYHDRSLKMKRLVLHRSRTALVASDHLPLVADFHLEPAAT